jgi:hypothetical protein
LLGEPIGNALAAPLGIKPSPPPGIADTVEKESGEATLRRDAASRSDGSLAFLKPLPASLTSAPWFLETAIAFFS